MKGQGGFCWLRALRLMGGVLQSLVSRHQLSGGVGGSSSAPEDPEISCLVLDDRERKFILGDVAGEINHDTGDQVLRHAIASGQPVDPRNKVVE